MGKEKPGRAEKKKPAKTAKEKKQAKREKKQGRQSLDWWGASSKKA